MPGHQDEVVGARKLDELLHLLALHRRRLLDEDVLARLERLAWPGRSASARGSRSRPRRRCRPRAHPRTSPSRVPADSVRRSRPAAAASVSTIQASSLSSPTTRHDVLAPAADAGVGDARHSFQTFSSAMPRAPERVAEVDDERGLGDEPRVVDARVSRRDHDGVVCARLERLRARALCRARRTRGRADRGRRRRRRRSAAARSASPRATRACRRCPPCRRRRARGSASRCSDLPSAVVERLRDPRAAVVRHVLVDLARELDEPRREVELARLPGEVEGVDRDAVAAEAGARARSA